MKRIYTILFLAIVLLNVGLAINTEIQKQNSLANPLDPDAGCFGADGSCTTVQFSQWGQFFGVSTAVLGAYAFAALAILWIVYIASSTKKPKWHNNLFKLIVFAHMFAGIGALYFIYLQLFILKTICQFCIVIDTLAVLMAIAMIILIRK